MFLCCASELPLNNSAIFHVPPPFTSFAIYAREGLVHKTRAKPKKKKKEKKSENKKLKMCFDALPSKKGEKKINDFTAKL